MNPIRRLVSIFGQLKRDLAVCLDDTQDAPPHATAQRNEDSSVVQEADQEEDEYSDDGEPDEDDEDDRRNFKAIRAITRKDLGELVLKTVYPAQELSLRTCHVTSRKEGSFHHAVFLRINIGERLERAYVLKIPAHGTQVGWLESDAYMLRNEAVLMQHIRHHTQCPVPEVIAFDETLDNPIGAPYILMEEMAGSSALDMWFGKSHNDVPNGEQYLEADDPSLELEQKRTRFLASLAQAMSHLQNLEFKRIGIPVFNEPEDELPTSYGPVWRWHSQLCMQEPKPIGPYITAGLYFRYGLNQTWGVSEIASLDPSLPGVLEFKGVRKIWNMVLTSPPFAKPPRPPVNDVEDNETDDKVLPKKIFVLRHDDLDLQNILVDCDGNVTGIIDWDGCMAAPRCVGYASLPVFLRRDWLPNYSTANWLHMNWSLKHYRAIYTDAMAEACCTDDPTPSDAQFTKKSVIYQALLAALYEDEDCRQVIGKLLAEIEEFRHVNFAQLCVRLGKGWPAAEKVLKEKIVELLAPEA